MELKEQLKKVAELRENLKNLKTLKDGYYADWENQYRDVLSEIIAVESEVRKAEDLLRADALERFLTGDISEFSPAVKIKVFTKLDYDPKLAFDWALEHKICLKLDTSSFEKMAKMAPETKPGFVKVYEEPQAQISQDLSKFIEEKA